MIAATSGFSPAVAAKTATTTIPIVFVIAQDLVRLGLVASLARPGGNMTGINFFSGEVTAKRLELLRELVPAATRVAVLVDPANATYAEMRHHLRGTDARGSLEFPRADQGRLMRRREFTTLLGGAGAAAGDATARNGLTCLQTVCACSTARCVRNRDGG